MTQDIVTVKKKGEKKKEEKGKKKKGNWLNNYWHITHTLSSILNLLYIYIYQV